jgi:phage head maturation protease
VDRCERRADARRGIDQQTRSRTAAAEGVRGATRVKWPAASCAHVTRTTPKRRTKLTTSELTTPSGGAIYRASGYRYDAPLLKGYALKWGSWATVSEPREGRFRERFARGSWDQTIREDGPRIAMLFQHGRDSYVGDKPLGRLALLADDGIGPKYAAALTDATYVRDIAAGVGDGLYGTSFRFATMTEEYQARPPRSAANPAGIPERTITSALVRELSIVTWPAYKSSVAGLADPETPRADELEEQFALRSGEFEFWFVNPQQRSRRETRGWRRREVQRDNGVIRWRERDVAGRPGVVERVYDASPFRNSMPR